MFLEISINSQENTSARDSFLNKVGGLFYKTPPLGASGVPSWVLNSQDYLLFGQEIYSELRSCMFGGQLTSKLIHS